MSQMTMTCEGLQAVYRFAGQLLRKGVTPKLIEKSLTDQGLDAKAAAFVVMQARAKANKRVGRRNMIYGLLWCIGGIVVTALTYQAAVKAGVARCLAWGAILLGGIQFFRGVSQLFGR
jgi:hypothetical protein